MSDFDAEKVREHLDKMMEDVGIQADVDQQAAALDDLRDTGTWWAALSMLSNERGNTVAAAVATQHLKEFLHRQEHERLVLLGAYLLHNTINLVALHHEDGDIPAVIAGIVGPEDFFNFEKFVATSGASCPDCGHDDGWADHDCRPVTGYEPLEG